MKATANEVASAWLFQVDCCLSITVGADWVHGVAIREVCSVHFQHVVNWQIVEHCTTPIKQKESAPHQTPNSVCLNQNNKQILHNSSTV